MIRTGQFWALSLAAYGTVALVVGLQTGGSAWALLLCALHALLATSLNASLIAVIRARRLSLIGGPLVTSLTATATYFSFSVVKYLVPNPVYGGIFDLTVGERFAGSALAAVAIALGAGVLWLVPQPRQERLGIFLLDDRQQVGVLACAFLLAIGSKAALLRAGYGSPYAETMRSVANPESFGAVVLLSIVGIFDYFSFLLALVVTWRLFQRRLVAPAWMLTAASLLGTVAWVYLMKARMPFVHLLLILAFSLQVTSWRRAVLAVQSVLIVLPLFAVLGASSLAIALGRPNARTTALHDVIGEVAYRADLTDLAVAFGLRMGGNGAGPAVVVDALSVAVPRVVWPNKDAYYTDSYYRHLEQHGFPRMDYLEMPFSNGFVAFGWVGFVGWPVCWWTGLAIAGWALERLGRRRPLVLTVLVILALVFIRVEMEWIGVALQVRDAAMFAIMAATLVLVVRVGRAGLRLIDVDRWRGRPRLPPPATRP